jgi:chromosome segregation ATPase
MVNLRSKIKDQRSKIKDQRSKIKDQRSKIKDQRSKIKDQRSKKCTTAEIVAQLGHLAKLAVSSLLPNINAEPTNEDAGQSYFTCGSCFLGEAGQSLLWV